ncbi:MAG: hypothetical protein Kow0073_10180 [Immundisolibacter sp.]
MQTPIEAAPPGGAGKHSSFDFVRRAVVLEALAGGRLALDLGCGRGEWSLALARAGTPVLALDRWWEGLRWLTGQAQGLPLLALRADLAAPLPLPTAAVDRVLLALVLHHLVATGAAAAVLAQVARVLAPGGVLAVVEFLPVPPPPGPPLAIRLAPAKVLELGADAGLTGGDPIAVAPHVALYRFGKPS